MTVPVPIHEDLIEMFDRVREMSERSARLNPTLTTLKALLARRTELEHDQAKAGYMDVRERAWLTGETAAVRAMIAECLGHAREEKT